MVVRDMADVGGRDEGLDGCCGVEVAARKRSGLSRMRRTELDLTTEAIACDTISSRWCCVGEVSL